ncbi:hypothetical protein [Billgrantia montanilacus]|uniref:Uncharacterized protein n=1 Tax=Billgrantia montanilacus TaxID=2282305 RepID=A0A368U1Y9_9GAMM|nr:hypothetical protein [Halomonas montanilacus]RCV90487.1 hypothetical protein DU505_06005 [Halomonas montanilacus]
MRTQQQQLAALPVNDPFDTCALAQEHLEQAEALFQSIRMMIKNHAYEKASTLALMGYEQAGNAAEEFHSQLQILDAREEGK